MFRMWRAGHFAKDCPDRADRRGKKGNVNTVIASNEEDKEYGNLPFIFSVFQSPNWWLDISANVHVCSDINLFSSYQGARDSSVDRKSTRLNSSHITRSRMPSSA